MIETFAYDTAVWLAENPILAGSTVGAGLLVMIANLVTMFVPTQIKVKGGPLVNQLLNLALRLLNMVSLNVLANKNKDDKAA